MWTGSSCTSCAAGSVKPTAGNEGACTPCTAGSFAANTTVCLDCPVDTFQAASGASACAACHANSSSVGGSTSAAHCLCLPGFASVLAACVPCNLGFYKEALANEACQACPTGYSTTLTASTSGAACTPCAAGTYLLQDSDTRTCVACPTNSLSLAGDEGVEACQCAPGFTGPNDACAACAVGKYKPARGAQGCTLCPDGHVGVAEMPAGGARIMIAGACEQCGADTYTQDLATCASCPANTQAPAGSDGVINCVCNAGFIGADGGPCEACVAGTYKTTAGSAACALCPANTWGGGTGSVEASTCLACPNNSVSAAGSGVDTACLCSPGFTGVATCEPCAPGSFKSTTGSAACTLCPTGTYYDGAAPYTSNECTSCGDNTVQAAAAGVGFGSCVCAAGHIREGGTCRPCAAGSYCPSDAQETQCYSGSTSPAGGSGIEACVCVSGHYANCTGESCHPSCLLCPVNAYCPGGEALVSCPADATTLTQTGSVNASACVCNPGWYEQDGLCVPCNANSYCVNDAQVPCPPNSTALAGTGSRAQCFCDATFTRDAGGQCQACGPHLVCEGVQTQTVDGVTVLQAGAVYLCGTGALNQNQRCVCAPGASCGGGLSNASCVSPQSCSVCPAGVFCSDNVRTQCPANETSAPGSDAPEDCHCVGGYYRSEGRCLQCPIGAYCVDEALHLCASFDAPLTTVAAGQSSPAACVCPAGDFRAATNDTCKPCPADFFCPQETHVALPNVVACGENTYTDGGGHAEHSACKCFAGFVLTADSDSFMKCIPCPPGHRCADGEVLEFFCHLENRTANADHSKCVCLPGFEEIEGLCAPCAPGFFKAGSGDEACAPCDDTRFHVNATTCGVCSENEQSSIDFLSCVCQVPFVRGADGQCVLCGVDHYFYKGFGIADTCEPCPPHSSTQGLEGQINLAACVCDAGHRVTEPTCVVEPCPYSFVCDPCPSGTYEAGGVCVSCGEGAISEPGSTSADACTCNTTRCQQFVWGDACSGECEAAPEPCIECAPGHYKDFVSALGNTATCLQCSGDHYQPATGQTACLGCHETRTTPTLGAVAVEACVCRSGYEETNSSAPGACSACAAGHFKTDIGDFACSECAIGFFASAVQSTACLSCAALTPVANANTTLAVGSTDAENCTCLAGYMLEAGTPHDTCEPCQQGSYKSSPGEHACRLCGEDTPPGAEHDTDEQFNTHGEEGEAAVSNTHCLACPPFSGQDALVVTYESPLREVTDCLCFPAHTAFDAEGGCVHCSEAPGGDWTANYSFKLGYSNAACEPCTSGEYFVAANVACQRCELPDAANATRKHVGVTLNIIDPGYAWGTDFDDCDCDLGHTRVLDACHPCAAGSFRNDSLDRACYACGLDEYQDTAGQTQCHACPAHSYTEGTGSSSVLQCLCESGYEWDETSQTCVECTAGTSKGRGAGTCAQCPEDAYSLARSAQCTACGPDERAPAGSGSPFACNCRPGFGSADGGDSCSLCGNGTFSGGGTGAASSNPQAQRPACAQCPANKSSAQGSTQQGSCKCVPGHGDAGNSADDSAECSPCENGFYASGGSNLACFSCGFGAITDPPQAAFAFSCCQCDAGRGLYAT